MFRVEQPTRKGKICFVGFDFESMSQNVKGKMFRGIWKYL